MLWDSSESRKLPLEQGGHSGVSGTPKLAGFPFVTVVAELQVLYKCGECGSEIPFQSGAQRLSVKCEHCEK